MPKEVEGTPPQSGSEDLQEKSTLLVSSDPALPVAEGSLLNRKRSETILLPVGMVVGEYIVDSHLGKGGMSTVYSATHPVIEKRAAIKVISTSLSKDEALVQRFIQEARSVNKIGHPNIVDVFSFGELADGRCYYMMELLQGQTLAQRLEQGPIPLGEALKILEQVLDALDAAHSHHVIHRDLKPANVFLVDSHNRLQAKLLDFGIAKLYGEEKNVDLTQTGFMIGTPAYVSPEQARGKDVDHRTDIYALGTMAFEMLLGRVPFRAGSAVDVLIKQVNTPPPRPSSLWPEVPPPLEDLLLQMLSKNREARPTLAEVRQTLAHIRSKYNLLSTFSDDHTVLPVTVLSQDPTLASARRIPLQDLSTSPPKEHSQGATLHHSSSTSQNTEDPQSLPPLAILVGIVVAIAALFVVVGKHFEVNPPALEELPTETNPAREPPLKDLPAQAEQIQQPDIALAETAPSLLPTANAKTLIATPRTEPNHDQIVAAPKSRNVKRRTTTAQSPGFLTVNAKPWVRVWIDGKEVARETPLRQLKIEGGQHTLRVANPTLGFRAERRVRVRPGQELSIFVDVDTKSIEIR